MLGSLLIIALVAGLFLYLYPFTNEKVVRIGEILLASSIFALLLALAPAAVNQTKWGSVLIISLVAGLFLYLYPFTKKVVRIGEILLASSILALLLALAPATVKLLQS